MAEPMNQEPQGNLEPFETGQSPTYEALRDELSAVLPSTRSEWQGADKRVAGLRQTWASLLEEDSDYTEEARARMAEEHYEREKDKIESAWASTKEQLGKSAAACERMSVPRPPGQSLEAQDTNELLAAQNEASRIVRQLDRLKDRPGPFKPDQASFLKSEYQKGMEQGGVSGTARCRGARAAAEELGVGDEWLDSLRTDKQRKYLDDARRLDMAYWAVPTTVPKPPRSLQKAVDRARRKDMYQQRQPFFVSGNSGEPSSAMQSSEPSHSGEKGSAKRKRKKSWK
jgi:hypothetical protein